VKGGTRQTGVIGVVKRCVRKKEVSVVFVSSRRPQACQGRRDQTTWDDGGVGFWGRSAGTASRLRHLRHTRHLRHHSRRVQLQVLLVDHCIENTIML